MSAEQPPSEGWWPPDKDDIRSRVADVNDGVLAVAGLAEGLSLVLETHSLPTIVTVAAIAGAVSIGGAKYAETAAEREVQQELIRTEQYLLELSPDEELEELVQHFRGKGVSEETARRVADELNAADALTAQLETEYEILTPGEPFKEAFASSLSFLAGALVTVLIAITVPRVWVEEYILLGVLLSLSVTAVVLSRLGGTRVWTSILRSVSIGLGAMGASLLVGALIG